MPELYEVSDIQGQVEFGQSLDISHSILHRKTKFKDKYGVDIIHCTLPLLTRYVDLISDYIIDVEMTEEEFKQFRYQPKALSLEHYGTTELWSSILSINNMDSVVEFNKKKLKLFRNDIMDILEEILILEEDNIKDDREYIESQE